jgi:nicotinate-nucleotide adenylyltransferase
MKTIRKVALFGGTFDPIHFGHLNMALEILEARKLDEVWFCPAQINPHKQGIQSALAHHRAQMVSLAIEQMPCFKHIDTELKRPGPSFTIDTLKEPLEHQTEFSLLIGEDSVLGFFQWHQAAEIVKLVPIYVGCRLIKTSSHLTGDPAISSALEKGMTKTHIMEISATEIRERVSQKKNIWYLTPSKVVDYIYDNHLYLKN